MTDNDNTSTAWSSRMLAASQPLGITSEILEQTLSGRMGITKDMGVSVLDDDDVFKFGDFREVFNERPIAVLRMAFKALRGGNSKKTEIEHTGTGTGTGPDERTGLLRQLGFKVKLEDADVSLLLPHYLPDKPSDAVTIALRKRYQDRAVLAFHDDGKVAVVESVQYIADLEQGLPERETIEVDGKLARLYAVGIKPSSMVNEDPLFPGQPLRNERSIVNNRNWSGISTEKRQLCRIIVDRGDIDTNNKEAVLRLLERAATDTGLHDAYPEAELEFRERKQKDDLPKLKVQLGNLSSKPNNPFGVKRNY